jgi:hypothetical protein
MTESLAALRDILAEAKAFLTELFEELAFGLKR